MDPLQWLQLLTPLAILVTVSNLLVGLPFNNAHVPRLTRKLSLIGYSGMLLGWLIMRYALTLTPVSSLMYFSIIGWLLLVPATGLTGIICLWRLFCKNNFLIFLIRLVLNLLIKIIRIISRSNASDILIKFSKKNRKTYIESEIPRGTKSLEISTSLTHPHKSFWYKEPSSEAEKDSFF